MPEGQAPGQRISRRRLIQTVGAAGGAAALGPLADVVQGEAGVAAQAATPAAGTPVTGQPGSNLPPNVPVWMTKRGADASPYGERSSFEKNVLRQPTSQNNDSLTPLQDLHGTITPNSLFYERTHAGVPAIDPAEHRLMVHGMVERPTIFTMDDLKRFPAVSVIHFMECSGNSGSLWKPEGAGGTVQDIHGLLSCTEWTGVPVATIMHEVGAKLAGTWVLAEGADAAAMTRSVPMAKMMNDALLAYAQNGEAIRPSQGYPLRLVLPGWEGNINVKWLRRLEIGDRPWETREETSKYTDVLPDGIARQFTFVMEAKSVITSPSGGQRLDGPGFYEIRGLAWSGRGKIAQVDVSADGGKTWTKATLNDPVLPIALTRFRLPWTWDGKPVQLQSRVWDETGYLQPTVKELVAARGLNSGYHMNGITTWSIATSGEVSNVYV